MQLFPARDENTRVEIARNIAFSFDRHDDFFRDREFDLWAWLDWEILDRNWTMENGATCL